MAAWCALPVFGMNSMIMRLWMNPSIIHRVDCRNRGRWIRSRQPNRSGQRGTVPALAWVCGGCAVA